MVECHVSLNSLIFWGFWGWTDRKCKYSTSYHNWNHKSRNWLCLMEPNVRQVCWQIIRTKNKKKLHKILSQLFLKERRSKKIFWKKKRTWQVFSSILTFRYPVSHNLIVSVFCQTDFKRGHQIGVNSVCLFASYTKERHRLWIFMMRHCTLISALSYHCLFLRPMFNQALTASYLTPNK